MLMTTVNWERESGDKVEEFAAALILLDNPQGNRITPSRGDGGIDIQVESEGRWDIYQVKKFSSSLTASQKKQIEESWNRFITETLPKKDVRSWTLVMPWDPTREQLEWRDELTKGCGFEVHWLGRTQLDFLASGRPAVVDYFFGDGGQRITGLMEQMLALRNDFTSGQERPGLIERIVERQQQVVEALSHVDPFYRYVVEIRTGNVGALTEQHFLADANGASLVHYVQTSDEQYATIRVVPLSAESSWLRPIGGKLSLTPAPDSEHAAALKEFLDYGIRIDSMPGQLIEVTDPTGLSEAGDGLFSIVPVFEESNMPPLELQVRAPEVGVVLRLPLVDVEAANAPRGDGFSMTAKDASGTLTFSFKTRTDGDLRQETFNFRTHPCVGKYPGDVLPAIRFLSLMDGKNEVTLAIRGGRPILRPLAGENETRNQAARLIDFLEDLVLIQEHTHVVVVIPDFETLTEEERAAVGAVAKMLRGEKAEGRWNTFTTDGIDAGDPMFSEPAHITVVVEEPMSLTLEGTDIELDAWMRTVNSGIPDTHSLDEDGNLIVSIAEGTLISEMIEPPSDANAALDAGPK